MKRLLLTLLCVLLCVCGLPLPAGADEADPLRAALRPEWIRVEADRRIAGDSRLIVVIGENHASVRGQLHLAKLLQQLLDHKQVEAILVEGSAGPIETRELASKMAELLPAPKLAEHWRRQLEWGQLAGWEYVALNRPQVPAHGVEDMAAKLRFEITQLSGTAEGVQQQLASWERGAGLLEQAITALEGAGAKFPPARTALAEYRRRLRDLGTAAQAFIEKRRPALAKQIELLELGIEIQKISRETGLAELAGDEERLRQRWAELVRDHPAQLIRLGERIEKSQEMQRELARLASGVEPAAATLVDSQKLIEDAYFGLANQVRTAAEDRWGGGARPPAVEESSRRVERFFLDEANRAREEDRATWREQLAERDRAMAVNTAGYLREKGAKRVVLIVGAAHLEGMMAELARLGLPFVVGRLLPEDSVEPWEESAWEARRQQGVRALTLGEIKEESRLLDPVWREEQLALLKRALAASVEGEVLVLADDKLAFHHNRHLPDQSTPRGEQVLAYGSLPGRPEEVFEIWDRELGLRLVSELSREDVEVAYGYHQTNAEGLREDTMVTRQGKRTLDAFLRTPPGGEQGGPPSYVVGVFEPDAQKEGGVIRSPLRDSLGGGGRGGGNGPPSWTVFSPQDPERPRLVLTLDPKRGVAHIGTVRKQELKRLEFSFLKGLGELAQAKFGERNGANAGVVVLVVHNDGQLRDALRQAAAMNKLENKQIALITCGEAFQETSALREYLLAKGALMVWTPDRQLTPRAGERLWEQVQKTLEGYPENKGPRDIDELIRRAIADLLAAEPNDPELQVLIRSWSWVELSEPESEERDRDA